MEDSNESNRSNRSHEKESLQTAAVRLLETAAVTFAGGLLFSLMHVPLSWMLGPLTATLLWQGLTKRQLAWPVTLRNGGLLLLGYGMGLSFTMESARQIVGQLPSMLASTVLTVGFSLLMSVWIARAARITPQSSLLGSIPGGLSQMVVLGEEFPEADGTIVTFMQTIRLLTVVFIVPFLAVHGLSGGEAAAMPTASVADSTGSGFAGGGAFMAVVAAFAALVSGLAAVRLRMPTPWFLGPVIASALMMIADWAPPHPPSVLVLAAQWSLGIYLGLGIRFSALAGWRRLLPYSLAGGLAIVAFCLVLAYVFSLLHPISMATAFLSLSPGGMTEMGVTASAVHADVSMVVAYQMFRILFILFIVPYALRRLFRVPKGTGVEG
ncbi:AbrB family transcriptional regulator [Paenibacillus validus]|uniref:AbrB family transcriptional regulator n=3 Tax=Paenibacillus validus TaxID=44253 RepID=A0A7X3CSR1_9BACL|nr:AbrB family transcriptional regulator [Paenibacillus validus]MUG70257.1 AbrB family transcriptional regulator [Paenibacillus validus]